jgi:pimeloyl-ACP methyl ester carboxylesterase
MDLMRALLGDSKLNYLGYSYGTYLGATYAGLYPKRVGRFVLDGALDPSVGSLGVSVAQAAGFEAAIRSYMAYCVKRSDCPFRGSVDDGLKDVSTLLASVDRSPIRNSDGRLLGGDSLLTAMVTGMYSQSYWPYVTKMFTGVLSGDASTAFALVDTYYDRVDGQYESNSYEAFNAYNCMDYPDDDTAAQIAAAKAEIAAKAPTIAPYWSVDVNVCDVWPAKSTATREKITADGAGPIVVVGSTGDPATPYQWAQSLASQLSSGVLITRVGEGHTGYNKGNACIDDAVDAYLLRGTVPKDGLRCTS